MITCCQNSAVPCVLLVYPVGPVPRHVLFTNRWTQRPTLGFVDRSWPWPSRWRRAWRSPPATRRGDRDVVSGGQGGWPWKVARTVKWLMHVDDSATSRCTVKNHKKYRVSLGRGTQVSKEKKVSHLAKWTQWTKRLVVQIVEVLVASLTLPSNTPGVAFLLLGPSVLVGWGPTCLIVLIRVLDGFMHVFGTFQDQSRSLKPVEGDLQPSRSSTFRHLSDASHPDGHGSLFADPTWFATQTANVRLLPSLTRAKDTVGMTKSEARSVDPNRIFLPGHGFCPVTGSELTLVRQRWHSTFHNVAEMADTVCGILGRSIGPFHMLARCLAMVWLHEVVTKASTDRNRRDL